MLANVPLIYVHPAKARDGGQQFIEGNYERGQRVLVVDDLITTGGGVLETAVTLGMAGLAVKDIVVLIDRQEGARNTETLPSSGGSKVWAPGHHEVPHRGRHAPGRVISGRRLAVSSAQPDNGASSQLAPRGPLHIPRRQDA